MANFDNLSVRKLVEEMRQSLERGLEDGYADVSLMMPGFYGKPYMRFTAYERGFSYGRYLRDIEMIEGGRGGSLVTAGVEQDSGGSQCEVCEVAEEQAVE